MISKGRFIALYLLIAATSLYINFHADITVPVNRPLEELPITLDGWRMVSQSALSGDVIDVLRPTDYLSRTYEARGGQTAQLYIGYHGGGKESGEIHSPEHCLPGGGWHKDSDKRIQLDVGGRKINVVRAVYQKGGIKELFYYWFQVGDRTLSDEYSLKLAQIGSSILHGRRNAAFIRISVPIGADEERSSDSGRQFIRDFYPVIRNFLPL